MIVRSLISTSSRATNSSTIPPRSPHLPGRSCASFQPFNCRPRKPQTKSRLGKKESVDLPASLHLPYCKAICR